MARESTPHLAKKQCTNTKSLKRNQDRIRRLNKIGILSSWDMCYNLLPAYLSEKQHLWIPINYKTADGVRLYVTLSWIDHFCFKA